MSISGSNLGNSRVTGVDDLELLDEQRVDTDSNDGAEIRDQEGNQPEPASDLEWSPGASVNGGNQPGSHEKIHIVRLIHRMMTDRPGHHIGGWVHAGPRILPHGDGHGAHCQSHQQPRRGVALSHE